jgi:hypothetical protein
VTKDDWCVSYSDQVHSLMSSLSSLLVLVGSQVTPCNRPSLFLPSSGVNADSTLKLVSVCEISLIVGTIPTVELTK